MITSGPAAGPPSPSGVRRAGDNFQDLFVWGAAMRVISPERRFSQVEVEINGVGNVDDVVLRSSTGDGDLYAQVKWATNPADLLDEDFLFAKKKNGKSLLEKLYDSYIKLRKSGATPTLRLVTNRALNSAHPLLGHVDGRTDVLMPYAGLAGAMTDAGRAVERWAQHIGADRGDLLAMLEHLQFLTGRTVSFEREHVRTLMVAAGLDGSEAALQVGLNLVTSWVIGGKRIVTEEEVLQAVEGLRRREPSALLIIQAIDTDPHADEATVALNWVDLFDGDEPWTRIQPRDPAGWKRIDGELVDAATAIENVGWRSTLVRGAMRQATFFRVGIALPAVRGHTLRYFQADQLWSTDAVKSQIANLRMQRTSIGLGIDLAVAVGVTVDPTDAVASYLRDTNIPVGNLLTILPAIGANDQAVVGPGHAVSFAEQIRNLVRGELEQDAGATRIHLFLAGPGGLALLLGHRWNKTRPTVVYEHLGIGRGYAPAFVIAG